MRSLFGVTRKGHIRHEGGFAYLGCAAGWIREKRLRRRRAAFCAIERVLVLHNRYREIGGEERYVAQLVGLLQREAASAILLERSSAKSNGLAAASSLVRGGSAPEEIAEIVRSEQIDIVHAHNIPPLFGWRALAAAREAGAAVVLHLHNYRLFCAIGTVFRDGADCIECAPRNMRARAAPQLPRVAPEAATYAVGLRAWTGADDRRRSTVSRRRSTSSAATSRPRA